MIRLFPKSRSAWIRSGVIMAILIVVAIYRNVFSLTQLFTYHPQEGDLLFQSLPHGELVDAIEGITQSQWSHCGIVMHKGSHWVVVEAIGHVRETPLPLWIPRGRGGRFVALRPTAVQPSTLRSALHPYMGRPYDFRYAPGDNEIYCSELIFKAYRDSHGVALGNWQPLGELNWKPFEVFIRKMEAGALPLARPMITPVGLMESGSLRQVYP
ncbi:MAG TPA: YiiX/YebB-like N1pC/P60 family cysteine hydrolase [Chthoniobacteraceae bacterium]|nr:YiiX/YebB-like N1pC/P60 family cysteine hydrolase [Chthoniobacteraceae bacterium]